MCIHKYGKWGKLESFLHTTYNHLSGDVVTKHEHYQLRTCLKCGIAKKNIIIKE